VPIYTTEKELVDICQVIGPVNEFRLVYDNISGKSKGFGVCEYRDEETAYTAVKYLTNIYIDGRKLYFNFAAEMLSITNKVTDPANISSAEAFTWH